MMKQNEIHELPTFVGKDTPITRKPQSHHFLSPAAKMGEVMMFSEEGLLVLYTLTGFWNVKQIALSLFES